MYEIKENFPLKKYNTFGIDVKTRFFVVCKSEKEITDFITIQQNTTLPLMILGGGSNVLFADDFKGYILKPDIKGVDIVKETESEVTVRAGAGEDWDEFVAYCVEHGWGGVENLSLIPGNVGTCPIQNIGAYGVEVKDVITEVETIEIDTQKKYVFTNYQCKFGYRDSIFKRKLKRKHLISHVTFRLNKQPEFKLEYGNLKEALGSFEDITLKNIRKAVIAIREAKLPDPDEIGNAGSFFKNPVVTQEKLKKLQQKYSDIPFYPLTDNKVKIPAGWLIEKSGWKGKRKGNVGVHHKQALVLVNYGDATGEEILHLAKNIQQTIIIQFDIELEMEVNVV